MNVEALIFVVFCNVGSIACYSLFGGPGLFRRNAPILGAVVAGIVGLTVTGRSAIFIHGLFNT